MLWTSDVPQSGMTWSYVWGEVMEFVEEVLTFNISGMSDEACDVYTCMLCVLYNQFGINLPVVWQKSALSWIDRVNVWKVIFEDSGLVFCQKYLINGANYKKSEKVRLAIELAIKEQKF